VKTYKPLNLLNNKGFWPEKAALADAIKEILTAGKCRRPLPVRDYGRYRDVQWRNQNNDLVPYRSVDWYVYEALDEDRMQVDAERILKAFSREPWRNEDLIGDHYDLFVMEEDMFDPNEPDGGSGVVYTVGRSERFTAAVISTHRIEHIWGMPYSYLKTEVMRQLCFMFGIPDPGRDDVISEGSGFYCTTECILRPARVAPDDWQMLTEDRIRKGALCKSCLDELRRFFERAAAEAS